MTNVNEQQDVLVDVVDEAIINEPQEGEADEDIFTSSPEAAVMIDNDIVPMKINKNVIIAVLVGAVTVSLLIFNMPHKKNQPSGAKSEDGMALGTGAAYDEDILGNAPMKAGTEDDDSPVVPYSGSRGQGVARTPVQTPRPAVDYSTSRRPVTRWSDQVSSSGSGVDEGASALAIGMRVSIPLSVSGTSSMTMGGAATSIDSELRAQAEQSARELFAQNGRTDGGIVASQGGPLKTYTISEGTIIQGVLVSGINTDLPGEIKAYITRNVYDSYSGTNLLIPQGSILLADYNSGVTFGQNRTQISWRRIITPDMVSIDLGGMTGVDSKGYSGVKGSVNTHPWEYLKSIGLSVLATVIEFEIKTDIALLAGNPAAVAAAETAGKGIDDVSAAYLEKTVDIPPTLVVKPGTIIDIFVNSDILIPTAVQNGTVKKYTLTR